MKKSFHSVVSVLLVLTMMLVMSAGCYADSIDQSAAEDIALAAAGIAQKDADWLHTEIDTVHSRQVYEVEFRNEGLEYEFWISVADGSIVKTEWDLTGFQALERAALQASADFIGEEEAFLAALADASLNEEDVTLIKMKLDRDNALLIYEIEFCTDAEEYDYDIDAVTGDVCGCSIEFFASDEMAVPGRDAAASKTESVKTDSGREDALSIALKDAGLTIAEVTVTRNRLDYKDGRPVYEIEFVTSDAEYDYEIDVATGAVREKDIDRIKGKTSAAVGSAVDLEQAIKIALEHAGLSADDVTFKKTKSEWDDGFNKYEIEFRMGRTEYEYEINAENGSILEFDIDQDD